MHANTDSAQATRALGAALARQLRDGDVVLLKGEMGAGKSEFARGMARGLGIQGPIPSPSFTILNAYTEGSVPYHHFDWYRVADETELLESGLEEVIGQGVTVIEWAERAPALWPADRLEVTITPISAHERSIDIRAVGGFRAINLKEYT